MKLNPSWLGSYLPAFLLLTVSIACHAGTAVADESPVALPPGGTPMLGQDPFADVRVIGPNANALRHAIVPSDDGRFERVLRMETTQRTGHRMNMGIEIPLTQRLQNGDVIHVRLWARATRILDETGLGRMAIHIRHMPHRQPAAHLAVWRDFGSEWKLLDIPISGSRIAAEPGQSSISLFVGGTQPQTVEVAGLEVVNYGPDFDIRLLPFEIQTYPGREPDAPWRKDALDRIERIRKGDLTIRVLDAAGQPVPNAQVHARMTRHAYLFGTAVNGNWLMNKANFDSEDGQRLRAEIPRLFNRFAPANEFKWQPYEEWPARNLVGRLVKWAEDHNLTIHAHVLVWPSRQHLPKRLHPLLDAGDAEQMQAEILKHIEHLVGRFAGRIHSWDVINEPVDHNEVINLVGRQRMADWWRAAHRADPNARLYLNENNLLIGTKVNAVVEMVRFLQEQGAPIHGIGAQGHVGPTLSIETALRNLDRLAETGLPIEITEYDTITPDEELQGDFTRDIMIAVFSHPATVGFTMWGFWDGQHWLGNAPIYRRDWSKKPSGEAYESLVLGQWWTDETHTTDPSGGVKLRGFLGRYQITATTPDGQSRTVQLDLPREGAAVEVQLGVE
jgi:GH35 family endo-1,4-beta-xylanase